MHDTKHHVQHRQADSSVSRPTHSSECLLPLHRRAGTRIRRKHLGRQGQTHSDLSTEAREILIFATTWAPYGGPSSDELFVQFGMPTSRFVQHLWSVLDLNNIDPDLTQILERAYPRPNL